jgi:hemoglobin
MQPNEMHMRTLLEELGGRDAVEMVVAAFYERVLADPMLAHFFRGVQMSRLYKNQADFFCAALGDPEAYRGRDMRSVHAGMNIGDAEFDAVAGHLAAALAECGVGQGHIDTVIGLIAGLRPEIVTRSKLREEFFRPVQQPAAASCPMHHAVQASRRWMWSLVVMAVILAALAGLWKMGVVSLH